ncbi:putative dual-specificity kinase CMGC-DYRK-PRP4 family [Medicago truncatula]|uniref:Putative dual-specificity kinase CMGC-DYRK-PRP4 family n=1 Tax=Medicago truncatula TaxID=3880 RepID=A0A072UFT7_MEDTR|nr:DYRK-family kinase pom1 [Medicago truncatula]KEH28286.1 Serine/Threonine kinase domain protein [Medicago truncatula]RHN57136.1 putative dual-specificity kinase CMGC-DYRK-PRP4 family [Medicago truncatula]
MAVSNSVEAVFEFLRKNGLSEAESALRQDIIDKHNNDLASFDYEKFFFPMVPPPPPVKLRSFSRPSEFTSGDGQFSKSNSVSSEEQFVSIASSTSPSRSRVSSSEFINPYGINSSSQTQNDSESSSDRLSQFGTARDYHEFDMQHEPYWYNENDDDDDFMTPDFDGPDFFGCQSEDKFILNSETENQQDDSRDLHYNFEEIQLEGNEGYIDKSMEQCLCNHSSGGDENATYSKDYCHGAEKEAIAHNCEVPFCKSSPGSGGSCSEDPMNFSYLNLKEIKLNLNDFHMKDINSFDSVPVLTMKHSSDCYKDPYDLTIEVVETDLPNGIESYEVRDDRDLNEELHVPEVAADGEDNNTDDDLLKYIQDDEYEVFELRIVHRKNRTGFEENKEVPIVLNSVMAGRYYVTEYLGSAAFSRVVQAHDLQMGIDVCLKIIKNDKDFFDQSLDEIKLLKLVNKHDPGDKHHILRLYDYFYHQEHLFIVTELLRANLYEFQKFNQESGGEAYFTLKRLQLITRQCLEALQYLHNLGIVHCDLKPENVLIKSYKKCEIKIIDLGSSCFKTDNLCLYVQSRSYRAPEVMLGLQYDEKIDIWSLGCILAELCSGEVLFPNDAVVMILARMIGMFGPFDMEMLVKGQETHKYFTKEYDIYFINEETDQLEYIIPEETSLEHHLQINDTMFIDFVSYLLNVNPKRRPTARQALKHPWLSYVYKSM